MSGQRLPTESNFWGQVADCLRSSQTDRAIEMIELAIEESPDTFEFRERLGIIFHAENRVDEAISSLEYASAFGPLGVPAQLALAECYSEKGYLESAKSIYEFLKSNQATSVVVLPDVARGFARLGQYADAMEVCELAVRKDPECDKALYGLAYYKAKCGHSACSVINVMQRVISLVPNSIEYRVVAAKLCLQSNHTLLARQFLPLSVREIVSQCECVDCIQRLRDVASELDIFELEDACNSRLLLLNLNDD